MFFQMFEDERSIPQNGMHGFCEITKLLDFLGELQEPIGRNDFDA